MVENARRTSRKGAVVPKRKPLHPSTNVRWGRKTSTVVRGMKKKKPGKRDYGPMMPR